MNEQSANLPKWLSWMAPALLLVGAGLSFVTGHAREGFAMLARPMYSV